MIQPVLYLPVEEKDREFQSKVFLACAAAERGCMAVVGQWPFFRLNLDALPPGIVLTKGMNAIQRTFITAAKEHGHMAVSMDEEALGSANAYWICRDIDPEMPALADQVYAQGSFHRDVLIRDMRFAPDQVKIIGNPRLDFLRPEFLGYHQADVEVIRRKVGRFVLLNTNCGAVNAARYSSLDEYKQVLINIGWIDPHNPDDWLQYEQHIKQDTAHFSAMRDLVQQLPRALPDHRVILRPHPAEDIRFWHEHTAPLDRVHVVREGNVIPWMMASDVVIQTGCTTGVEANILNRPCISITPRSSPHAEIYLSNLLNPTCEDAGSAVALCRRTIIDGDRGLADLAAALRGARGEHLMLDEAETATARLLDALIARAGSRLEPASSHGLRSRRDHYRIEVDERGLNQSKMQVRIEEAHGVMARLRTTLGRFDGHRLTKLHDSVFVIHDPDLGSGTR